LTEFKLGRKLSQKKSVTWYMSKVIRLNIEVALTQP